MVVIGLYRFCLTRSTRNIYKPEFVGASAASAVQEQELDLEERSPPRPCVRELPRPPVPPGSPALPLSEEQVPVPRENVGKCRKSPGISGSSSSLFLGSFCHRSFGNRQEGEVPEVPEVPKEAAEESTKSPERSRSSKPEAWVSMFLPL